jgi:hypothetical protein
MGEHLQHAPKSSEKITARRYAMNGKADIVGEGMSWPLMTPGGGRLTIGKAF